ncbi:hypothetical protein KJ758_02095 [Patescibacteria group bacterium]|nr:hypothetical protein [Patescibacteria group bacterium]
MKEYITVTKEKHTGRGNNAMVPLGDIIDRLSILQLTAENGKISETDENLVVYANLFNADCRLNVSRKQEYLRKIRLINKRMWPLESILRNPENRPLEMIGRIALLLRDSNRKRIEIRQNIDAEVRASVKVLNEPGNKSGNSNEEASNLTLNLDCQFRFAQL